MKLCLLCGSLFFCLILAASISAPALPDTNLPVAEYTAEYAASSTGHVASTFISQAAAILFVFFLAGFHAVIRPSTGEKAIVPLLVLLGGVVSIGMIQVAQAVYATAATAATFSGVEPGFVRGLDALVPVLTLYSGFPRAVFLLAAAAAIIGTGVAPRWLAIVAIVAGVVSILGTGAVFNLDGSLVPIGLAGMVLFAFWTLLASVSLLVSARQAVPYRSVAPA